MLNGIAKYSFHCTNYTTFVSFCMLICQSFSSRGIITHNSKLNCKYHLLALIYRFSILFDLYIPLECWTTTFFCLFESQNKSCTGLELHRQHFNLNIGIFPTNLTFYVLYWFIANKCTQSAFYFQQIRFVELFVSK